MIRLLAIDLDCQESHTPTLSQHEADAIYALRAARIDLAILTSDPDALKREPSCSLETPPNRTAMVVFANIVTPSHRFCGPRLCGCAASRPALCLPL